MKTITCKEHWTCLAAKVWRVISRAFGLLATIVLLSPVCAQGKCPVEVKILLSSPETESVILALDFKKKTESQIYFFDTESLGLLRHGAIIRIRQGADNDLTVKFRMPIVEDTRDNALARFPCEIDRTRGRVDLSYAVARHIQVAKVPETGAEVHRLLDSSQRMLLANAGISIDWDRVAKIASIRSIKWQTGAQSPHGKLALELWQWRTGKMLEVSSKSRSASATSKYNEVEELLKASGLPLNADQATKTSTVLESLANHALLRR
jgi:hypothetical protein